MKESKTKEKLAIISGLRIGRIAVVELVYNVREHSLFIQTPVSYLQQGRLYEVACDCGTRRLISESILATGRIQSCGCLRQELRAKSSQAKIDRLRVKAAQIANIHAIKIEQAKLAMLQLPGPQKDEKAIESCAARLRQLFVMKGQLNRKRPQVAKKVVSE